MQRTFKVWLGALLCMIGTAHAASLNEIRADQSSTDTDEYIEIYGNANESLNNLSVIIIGDGTGGSGVIESVVNLSGQTIPSDGFFVIAESTFTIGSADLTTTLDLENSDNLTILLVSNFTGSDNQDLDTNDDGQLDSQPWSTVVDAVSMVEQLNPPSSTEYEYATSLGFPAVGPNGSSVPAHIARGPDGVGLWNIGSLSNLADDTPGAANTPFFSVSITLNEVRIDQDGTDNDEYVELVATANNALDGFSFITIGDGTGGSGVIETVVDLTGVTAPADGFVVIAESTLTLGSADITTSLNFENSDNLTHLVVFNFTGNVGDDLDTNDDGTLDVTPWASVYDAVAMVEEVNPPTNTEYEYASSLGFPVIGPDGSFVPAHIARTPDQAASWQIGSFTSLAEDTPGAANLVLGGGGNNTDIYINEARIKDTSTGAGNDYVELYGPANGSLDDLTYIVLGENKKKKSGYIEFVADLSGRSLDANGLFVFANSSFNLGPADWQYNLKFEANDNVTHLLVKNFTGSKGNDLDTNDDGMLDSTPWGEVVDAVAFVKQANPPTSTEYEYASVLGFSAMGPVNNREPWHVYRATDGGSWNIGGDGGGSNDTPGSSNGSSDDPPSVISTVPTDNATGVALSSTITINFSEDVSVTNNFYDISCPASGVHTGTISGGPSSYVITPDTAFSSNEECTVIIFASDVTDLDGSADNMASNYVFRFTTEADAPPQVNSTTPADQATNVAVATNININFSEPVTVSGSWFDIQCTVGGQVSANVSGGPAAYTLDPVVDLDTSDTCTVTVFAANVTDQDSSPENMTADYVFVFNTIVDAGNYYGSVDTSSASALRTSLHGIIDDHQWFPYTDSSTDTWDILELADEDPMNPNNVLDVYKNASYAKQGGGNSFYNREHTWPKSYGYPDLNSDNYPYTDTHMLYISDSGYNSSRSNKPYDNCTAACSENITEQTNGTGGGSGVYPGNSNWTTGSFESGTWQTWTLRKGDVARALLYMDVRYEGGNHGVTGSAEPDLILTDNRSLIQTTGSNASVGYMGILSVLIQWHNEDPPTAAEVLRNDVIYSYQGNRNPFIDHPEWVACVFQNQCSGL